MSARIVFENDFVTLWHGDARDVLPSIPKESVDLIVTDPPYGVEWESNRREKSLGKIAGDGFDERSGVSEVLRECVRIVGQNRHLYVFGPADALSGQKVSEVVELVWDKGIIGSGDVSGVWGPQHERISFCTSKFRHAGEAGKGNLPTRMRKGSVLNFMRPTGRKVRHPSEKPVPLLRELIESSSRSGDMIVDPYAGVASTGVAAILTGRRATLIEIDEQWIAPSIERLRAATEAYRFGSLA